MPNTFKNLPLAKQLYQQGNLSAAQEMAEQLLLLQADDFEVLHLLGIIAAQTRRYSQAIDYLNKALTLQPNLATLHNSLGNIYFYQKKFPLALTHYQHALTLNPNSLDTYNNLGILWGEQQQFTQAIACFQQVLTAHPQHADAWHNLGIVLSKQGKLTQALSCYQQAVTLSPHNANAYSSLAKLFKDKGEIEQSLHFYQKALSIQPHHLETYQNFLYTLNFSPNYDRPALFLAHQEFNRCYVLPLQRLILPYSPNTTPRKRLRLAYISPDFRKHSLTYFIQPLLAHHDHQQFEIFCYYNNQKVDEVTLRIQSYADHWCECMTLTDDELAAQIRRDQIDILIDLMGHTANNRALVFARKPAPIQVFNTIGYSNTTGLSTIDYRITDAYIDPVGIGEQFSSEQLIRMPNSYYCYQPNEHSPPVSNLPYLTKGYMTLGSFNTLAKLNSQLLQLWSKLLKRLPQVKLSILSLQLRDLETRQDLETKLISLGISMEQVNLGYAASTEETLHAYQQVDIALDTYPFNGATTTCQALWMGVPVVTLVGNTPAARAGLSILSTLGLVELIAHSEKEYIAIVEHLVQHPNLLQILRGSLRNRMQCSPLMDGLNFTRAMEQSYLKMAQDAQLI